MIHGGLPFRGRDVRAVEKQVVGWRKTIRLPPPSMWSYISQNYEGNAANCYGVYYAHQYSDLTIQMLQSWICDEKDRLKAEKVRELPFFSLFECPICRCPQHVEEVKWHVIAAHGYRLPLNSIRRMCFAAWKGDL